MTYVIIPAKNFQGAKQRLAALLQPQERALLARTTLSHTLTACTQAGGLVGVGVVTCNHEVADLARQSGVEVLWEPAAQGHTQAVLFGVGTCKQRGISSLLTLPGDLPLLTAADVEAIAATPAPAVVLVPNRDDSGTNAVLLRPPDCLPLAFGEDSFRRHLRLAAEQRLAVEIRRLPRVALDLDTPEDVAFFLAQGIACQTFEMLTSLGIVDRLAEAK